MQGQLNRTAARSIIGSKSAVRRLAGVEQRGGGVVERCPEHARPHQIRGYGDLVDVGRVLLEALPDRAREEGIRRFTATLLEINAAPVKELFKHVGQPRVESTGSGNARLRLDLL